MTFCVCLDYNPKSDLDYLLTSGEVTTVAGPRCVSYGYADGKGSSSKFRSPVGIVVDSQNNVFFTDSDNRVVRKITSSGNENRESFRVLFNARFDCFTLKLINVLIDQAL